MRAEASGWPFPGLLWGPYPQQRLPLQARPRQSGLGTRALRGAAQELAEAAPPADLTAALLILRQVPQARRDMDWLRRALSLAATAMLETLQLRPYWQQLMAALALLDQRLVEMDTGEGKTVAIALAAASAALAGTPVHVVTANDYLALRDAESLAGFYRRLGLRAAAITQPMEAAERRDAYGCDITYCTAKELAFDYLRDSMLQPGDLAPLERRLRAAGAGTPVLRGLCMAILDEADTILLDEARVPLILSQAAPPVDEETFLRYALALAQRLTSGVHFRVEGDAGVRLLPPGEAHLALWPPDRHPLLGHPQHRASTLSVAITAWHLLQRDRDYVVRDGQVLLVDETTGRAAPGRAWSRGLHQLVELKEGLATTTRNTTLTQITFQRFFVRYLRLAGISGTLRGAGGELHKVYGLRLVRVPSRTPRRVVHGPRQLLRDSATLWEAVAQRAADLRGQGRAVLIGTETVRQSEALSAVLRQRELPHVVLNARQDAEESAIVGAAGQSGRITVATSMAGRGAHIALDAAVVAAGGLHVILCQLNPSPRIDRQFLGRAGRQGQPGSVEVMVAEDFALLQKWLPAAWLTLLRRLEYPRMLVSGTLHGVQAMEASARAKQRVTLARLAELQELDLNFSRWGLG